MMLATFVSAAIAAESLSPPATPAKPAPAASASAPQAAEATVPTQARIVIVEWKIKKGHEQEFLDYWAKKSTIPDRAGLIAEFMSSGASRDTFPWINWATTENRDETTFYNIGIWRNADDFMSQIGKYIDNSRPPMPFEAEHRHRVFLKPLEWRIGMSSLPAQDAAGVK
ncbi:MAG TPA: hypothetical protein VH414_02140 [Lichenihabitans sp.]|nr:hypothetical protein [Lichenihabitans sp.]